MSNGAHDSQILRHRLPEAVADLQFLPAQRLGFLIAAPSLPLVTPVVRAGVWVRKELTPPARPGSERWASLCSAALLKTSRIIAPFGLKLGKSPKKQGLQQRSQVVHRSQRFWMLLTKFGPASGSHLVSCELHRFKAS